MNTILKRITNECYENPNNKFYKSIGNYKIKRDLDFVIHYYYNTTICVVNLNDRSFSLYSHGYDNCRLTTAQLNYLEKYYKLRGFKLRVRK